MIIVKISGGLGNQLFQYAFAKSLSIKRGLEVKIDTSCFNINYKTITPRRFLLDKFNITLPIATKEDFKKIGLPYPADNDLRSNLLRLKNKLFSLFGLKKVAETINNMTYNEEDFNIPDNFYVSGPRLNEKYFLDISDTIRRDLTLKNSLPDEAVSLLNKISQTNSVSINFRRGDYITKYQYKYAILDEKYYKKAIEIIKNKIEDPIFYVSSDDIEFVKNTFGYLLGDNVVYMSNQALKDYEKFWLMRHCKSYVIANSTFSWWMAWLNDNKEKIVVAPNKYRVDGKDDSDFIPKEWIKI